MNYTNENIERLLKEKEAAMRKYDSEIQKEIDKEKARYKFSLARFLLFVFIITMPIAGFYINEKIFPNNSVWSWNFYLNKLKH